MAANDARLLAMSRDLIARYPDKANDARLLAMSGRDLIAQYPDNDMSHFLVVVGIAESVSRTVSMLSWSVARLNTASSDGACLEIMNRHLRLQDNVLELDSMALDAGYLVRAES